MHSFSSSGSGDTDRWHINEGLCATCQCPRCPISEKNDAIPSKWFNSLDTNCKRFTYVAKTCANLTTYSRKPENYNGTIIFEIDIMKNSSPINLNLCQTWLFHNCFGCFFCFDLLWAELRVQWVQQKRIAVLVLTWQKVWILNWVGMSFSWCQSQK